MHRDLPYGLLASLRHPMMRQRLFSIVFFVLLGLLLYQMRLVIQSFVFPALWAVLLAHGTFPLHRWLSKLCKGNETLSAEVVRAWVQGGGLQRLLDQVATIPIIGRWLWTVLAGIDPQRPSLEQSVEAGPSPASRVVITFPHLSSVDCRGATRRRVGFTRDDRSAGESSSPVTPKES